jgi:hypothetical protein
MRLGKPKILEAVLDEVQTAVERSGLPVSFNAGLSVLQIRRLGMKLPFPLPKDVAAVYNRLNGCSSTLSLIPEFQFMPFTDVLVNVELHARLFPNGGLPLLTNGGGDFLYVDATKGKGSPIFIWRTSLSKANVPAFDSLLAFFRTVAEAYEAKLFHLRSVRTSVSKPGGVYETVTGQITEVKDAEAWRAIKEKLNPNSAKAGAYTESQARRAATVPEVIPIHIEELQRYGTLKTKISAKERRKETEEVAYLIETMTRQLRRMERVAPPQNHEHLRTGLENLKKLHKALFQ